MTSVVVALAFALFAGLVAYGAYRLRRRRERLVADAVARALETETRRRDFERWGEEHCGKFWS